MIPIFASTVHADLLIHYTFNLESGPTVQNAGTLVDGTIVGGGTYGPGQDASFGTAFYGNRDSLNDAYVRTGVTGDDLGMGAGGVYTAMAWINWAGVSGSNDHMVFGQEDGPGNNQQLHHGIRSEGPDPDADNIHFGGWGGDQDISDAGTVPPNEWTHVAWQYDGTNKKVFVNGVETASAIGNNQSNPALPVIVGGHGRDAPDPAGQSFNGAIDEVKIFDEVLTADEIMLQMDPGLDSDGDGLSDTDETTVYNTDPNDPDSDDDTLNDGVEVLNELDPNSAIGDDGADGDPDMDNLTNKEEIEVHFTNPQEADSDEDGLTDSEEIETHETDPNNPDSDDDTLTDGEEVNDHQTNPNSADSDSDLFSDPIELEAGSDPNDPNSIPDQVALPDPLIYYSFNDQDGVDVENFGTLEDPGSVVGSPTFGDSIDADYGQAFYGNRMDLNDGYVRTNFTGDDLGMGAGGVYTAMAWVNWAGPDAGTGGGDGDYMVFGQEDGPGNNEQLHHGIRADSAPNNIHFGGWGGAQDISDAGAVPEDEWTHVTWQYDGTNKVVFVNGTETANVAGNNQSNPTLPVIIGGHGRDAADPAGQSFNGAIDEVKIYGEVLTAEQIRSAMLPGESGGGAGLAITEIDYNSGDDTITIVFNSRAGRTYALLWSPDMQDGPNYSEIDDAIQANPIEEQTTYTFPAPRPDDDPGQPPVTKAFFFLREN